MDTNIVIEVARNLIQELIEQGYTTEEALLVLSTGVMTLGPMVHPAGFDMHTKAFTLSVTSVLAEYQSPIKH